MNFDWIATQLENFRQWGLQHPAEAAMPAGYPLFAWQVPQQAERVTDWASGVVAQTAQDQANKLVPTPNTGLLFLGGLLLILVLSGRR